MVSLLFHHISRNLTPSIYPGISSFTSRMFQEVLAGQPEKENVVISALSIHVALSLLFHGAGGKSRSELAQLLGVANIEMTEILGQAKNILTSYQVNSYHNDGDVCFNYSRD